MPLYAFFFSFGSCYLIYFDIWISCKFCLELRKNLQSLTCNLINVTTFQNQPHQKLFLKIRKSFPIRFFWNNFYIAVVFFLKWVCVCVANKISFLVFLSTKIIHKQTYKLQKQNTPVHVMVFAKWQLNILLNFPLNVSFQNIKQTWQSVSTYRRFHLFWLHWISLFFVF